MPGPAEMMDRAEEMVREGHDPAENWIRDQHEAAASELKPVVHEVAENLGKSPFEVEGGKVQHVAFGLAVFDAIKRRRKDERTCPHAEGLTPRPLVIDLNLGIMACQECIGRWADLPVNQDGHCDLCEEPGIFFNEFWITIGPALIHGDACDTCKSYLPAPEL